MKTLEVISPYDHHLIKKLPINDEKSAFAALALAHQTFKNKAAWLPSYQRIAILEKSLKIMQERGDFLASQASEEGGKPLRDSKVEVQRAINGVKIAIEQVSQMTGSEVAMGLTAASENRIAYTRREPVGVCLAISAFNHPLNLAVHQVIPAVAVGCPVLVKPASKTPLSCLSLVEILYEAGLPRQWCQFLLVENAVAEKLVQDERISFLSFIGSSKVGWDLRSSLAKGATCTLEHGGAAPVIIEPDADIDDAIPLLIKGGFYHAGQVCVSVQRIYVHDKLQKRVQDSLVKATLALKVGDPLDLNTDVGPLIDPIEIDRIDSWIRDAVKAGATLLCGGKRINSSCYAPTILLNPPDDAAVSRQEIFGPVICLYSYQSLNDAIARANQLPYSFQSAIFTKNIDVALLALKLLEANTVLVNDHTAFRVDWMPFAGRKQSGLGVGGIPYSMRDMTYEKLMVLRSTSV